MSSVKMKVATKSQQTKVLVVYCVDHDQKPRAAIFVEPEIELARKAAGLMGLCMHDAETPSLAKMQKLLPKGRVYASGWGFIPYIRPSVFADLLKVIGVPVPKPAKFVPQPPLPHSWNAIAIGHMVLAQAASAANGWWETLVESIEGEMLRLTAPHVLTKR